MTSVAAIGLTVLATLIGACGALFFKLGADNLSFKIKNLMTNWKLYIAVLLYGLSTIFFILALSMKGSHLSILYPFCALSYVWVEILSVKFLNEKMNVWKYAGIILIVLGVSFIGFG